MDGDRRRLERCVSLIQSNRVALWRGRIQMIAGRQINIDDDCCIARAKFLAWQFDLFGIWSDFIVRCGLI